MNEDKPEQNSKGEIDRTEPKILLFEKYVDWGIGITGVITIAYWLLRYRGKLFESETIVAIATITPLSLLITTFVFEIVGGLLVSILAKGIKSFNQAIRPYIIIRQMRRTNKQMAAGFKVKSQEAEATIAKLQKKLKKAGIDYEE